MGVLVVVGVVMMGCSGIWRLYQRRWYLLRMKMAREFMASRSARSTTMSALDRMRKAS
jgi:hypothetical protein